MRYFTYKFVFKPKKAIEYALDFMCINASKLWNTANYERNEFKQFGFLEAPDWFDQKKRLKDDFHYKNLLAQSAQDLLKDLELAWRSYSALIQKGIEANSPRYKSAGQHTCIKYACHSFKMVSDQVIRFSLPSSVKAAVETNFGEKINFFYIKLKNKLSKIKSISFHHLGNHLFKVCISYSDDVVEYKKDNGRHIGIDLGMQNLFAVYDNNGSSFIINGSSFKNTIYYFSKTIAKYQKILRASFGESDKSKAFKSRRIDQLYKTKLKRINYIIHKSTRLIANYCGKNDISVVAIGDMKLIKKDCSFGRVTGQQFYSIAFVRIIDTLEYKLRKIGVKLIRVSEAYSSKCPPNSKAVSQKYGLKNRRKKRGLYKYNRNIYNADCLGAFNILRIYYQNENIRKTKMDYRCISNPSNECIPVTTGFFDWFPCWNLKVGVAGRDYPSYEQIMEHIRSLSCPAEA